MRLPRDSMAGQLRSRLTRRTSAVFAALFAFLLTGATAATAAPEETIRHTVSVDGPAADEGNLRTECAAHPEAKTKKGWIKNRFETCVHQPVYLKLLDDRRRLRGELWFDLWMLGFSYDGSRRVDYVTSIENIRAKAVAGENPTTWKLGQSFSHSINASASDPNPAMTKPTVTSREDTIEQWKTKPQWVLTYTSPDTGRVDPGNAQRVAGQVTLAMNITSPTAVPWVDSNMAYSNVRFDYTGRAAGKHKGTVFVEARVELTMSLKDPEVDQSARHILDAQQLPERTFPSWLGKSVPGSSEPLHRLINRDKQDANRDVAIATCNDVWGNYEGSSLECDEYPFSSTYEGAAKSDNRYSARLIDGRDNRKGGERIQKVYEENRILDNDPFYVKIVP